MSKRRRGHKKRGKLCEPLQKNRTGNKNTQRHHHVTVNNIYVQHYNINVTLILVILLIAGIIVKAGVKVFEFLLGALS